MRNELWLCIAAVFAAACGGSVDSSEKDGQVAAAGQGGASQSHGGSAGSGVPLEDCGPDRVMIADLQDELLTGPLWAMGVSAAVTPTTLYVGFHDGMHLNVDRIYSIPRCGGTPKLLASELTLWPSSISAVGDTAYAVNYGDRTSTESSGELFRLWPWGVDKLMKDVDHPIAVDATSQGVFFLERHALRRYVAGSADTVTELSEYFTGLSVVGQDGFVSGPGPDTLRVDPTSGVTSHFANVWGHQLAQDASHLFACSMSDQSTVAVAIDKTHGTTTELGDCGIPVVVHGGSLFVGSEDGIMEYDLATLSFVRDYMGTRPIAVDDKHVFGVSSTAIWREHR